MTTARSCTRSRRRAAATRGASSPTSRRISQHFAGRPKEDAEIPLVEHLGVPLLEGALARLVCEVVDAHPVGDHTLYIGRVEHLEYDDGAPRLFFTGDYRSLELRIWDHSYIW